MKEKVLFVAALITCLGTAIGPGTLGIVPSSPESAATFGPHHPPNSAPAEAQEGLFADGQNLTENEAPNKAPLPRSTGGRTLTIASPAGTIQLQDNTILVSGVVTSALWSGVVTMTGDVVITAGAVITIAPGTEVRATTTSDWSAPEGIDPRVELIVWGSLLALGEPDQPITMTSAATSTAPADWYGLHFLEGSQGWIEHTVVECGARGLSLYNDTVLTVRHSTIRRHLNQVTSGNAYAAGIYASGNFTLTLQDSLLLHNRTHAAAPSEGHVYGGYIYLDGGSTTIQHSQILTSSATIWSYAGSSRGGGIYATGDGALTIEGSTIAGINIHGDANSAGGGLFLDNVQAFISDTLIANNRSEDEWGGNTRGGGLYIGSSAEVTITRSTIAENQAFRYGNPFAPIGAEGGGIYSAGVLRLSECTVRDNQIKPYSTDKAGRGAGVHVAGGSAHIDRCVLDGNEIVDTDRPGYGGGLYVGGGQVWMVNTLVAHNHLTATTGANSGGGIYVHDGTIDLINNTIVENHVDDTAGGIYVGSSTGITNTIFVSNTAFQGGGIYWSVGNLNMGYNDVWGNTGGNYYPAPITGTGDISANPLFVDDNADYHLRNDSPCVDAATGIGAPSVDFDGDPRPSGNGYEIGFDEIDVPIAGFSAINDSPTPLGQPTTLTATVVAGSSVSFIWALGDGASAGGAVVYHTYPAAGVYTAVVTASNSVSTLTTSTVVTIQASSWYSVYLPLVCRNFTPAR